MLTSPPVVAIASWLIPGAGYWLLGDRPRGTTIGVTVIALFMLGILVAGVRVLEVPMFDEHGQFSPDKGLIAEIRGKPWSVPQIMTGPVSILAGAMSVYETQPADAANDPFKPKAPLAHVHVQDIGSLYCSVAGLLNLMAILDAAYRASQIGREHEHDGTVPAGRRRERVDPAGGPGGVPLQPAVHSAAPNLGILAVVAAAVVHRGIGGLQGHQMFAHARSSPGRRPSSRRGSWSFSPVPAARWRRW